MGQTNVLKTTAGKLRQYGWSDPQNSGYCHNSSQHQAQPRNRGRCNPVAQWRPWRRKLFSPYPVSPSTGPCPISASLAGVSASTPNQLGDAPVPHEVTSRVSCTGRRALLADRGRGLRSGIVLVPVTTLAAGAASITSATIAAAGEK